MPVEKREQVFISSTYLDLIEERQEVIQTLLEADCIPAGMELFPASDDDRWSLIKRVIDDSDYYLVVIGGRYGSLDPDKGLSYTELEFNYAVSSKTPIMGFLHGKPGKIESDKVELEREARAHLEVFRAKVEARIVKYWTTADELGKQVAKSLIQIRKTHPAEGWIRGRYTLTPELEREIAELRTRVAELTTEIEKSKATMQLSIEALAQGDDLYAIQVWVSYVTIEALDAGGKSPRGFVSVKRFASECSATWNQIFAALGSVMIDDASEDDLSIELNRFVERVWPEQGHPRPEDFGRAQEIYTFHEEVHTVKIQLFSLGLIDKSIRRRAVTDNNTYWSNTQTGHDHLMRLRAIRRPAYRTDTDGEEEE